jgi:integrase/recombinase XerD
MRAHLFNMHGERLFFNEEERISFIQTTDRAENQKTRTFCSLLHYTGCNFTEAMKFTPQQVDFDAKVIAFPGPHHSQFSRTIPVPDSFLDLLDEVHGIRHQRAGLQAGERVWPLSKEGLHKQVRRVIAEAGIPEGPHAVPKGIRHGFFVHALRRRVMITRLQKWMGHSFPEYTAQYVADLLRQAPELLGDERADAERMWSIDSGHSFQS